jgi:hypothetical protein
VDGRVAELTTGEADTMASPPERNPHKILAVLPSETMEHAETSGEKSTLGFPCPSPWVRPAVPIRPFGAPVRGTVCATTP